MYLPTHFEETRPEILLAAMRENSFAAVVTAAGGDLFASHLPLMIDGDGTAGATRIRGHVARANPHWSALAAGAPALVIFQGPHGYVSPSWYEDAQSVPTWNYVTVHAHGRARLLDASELVALLNDLVEVHERAAARPWRLGALSAEDTNDLMGAIVGFEIAVDRLEGKLKLSQNRSSEDRRRVTEQLGNSADPTARAVARWMARLADATGTVDVTAGKP